MSSRRNQFRLRRTRCRYARSPRRKVGSSTLGANIARFAAMGLKVHITELDVRMALPSTTAQLQTQAQEYGDVLSTCLQYPACDLVVMWGFTDKESWVPSAFPGWGAALVFDAAYQAKPAYVSLHDLLK